ncbi:MAG TPA: hypothetical protein DCL54_13015 [Alphaproteobacteria bacterium]|nr:hypothetical protein [Alphaproteobacteria bacterium]
MVFADEAEGQALQDITRFWQDARTKAALPGICIHDLRDTFASLPASVGMTLPMIGKLSATCGFELRSASPTCSTIHARRSRTVGRYAAGETKAQATRPHLPRAIIRPHGSLGQKRPVSRMNPGGVTSQPP